MNSMDHKGFLIKVSLELVFYVVQNEESLATAFFTCEACYLSLLHTIPCILANVLWRCQSGIHPEDDVVPGFDCSLDFVIHPLIIQVVKHFIQLFAKHIIKLSAFPVIEQKAQHGLSPSGSKESGLNVMYKKWRFYDGSAKIVSFPLTYFGLTRLYVIKHSTSAAASSMAASTASKGREARSAPRKRWLFRNLRCGDGKSNRLLNASPPNRIP